DLFGHDARPRPAGKPRPAKKTKSDATASTGGSNASTQFGEVMEHELRMKREAAERAFEAQAERPHTHAVGGVEELRFLATSTKDLNDVDAYWIKKQKRLIRNKMKNDLGAKDDEDEDEVCLLLVSTIVFMGREPMYYILDNVLESVEDFPDYESVQPWCVDSFKYFNNLDEPGPRDSVGDVLVEVVELEHKLMCFGGDNAVEPEPKQVDSNNHSDVHAEDQDSPFQNMDMDANIHYDVHVEEQNSPVMDKEDLLASVSAVSDVCHQVVASETHHCLGEGLGFIYADSQDQFSVSQLLQGSVGFDNVLDLGCKDEFGDDNDQEGLVKLVNDLCIEEHISSNVVDAKVVDEMVLDDKVLDEKVLDAKVMDEKGQAILRLTATEDQQPPSDHQVYAGVGVDVHVDDVHFKYFNNLDEPGPRDSVGDVLVEVVELEHKLMCFGGDNAVEPEPKQVDSNNHSDVHAEDQDSPFQNMDMDANIHYDVHVEEQNSPVMDKEDLLASVSAVSDVCHQVVASETHHCLGEGLGFIYADSQDQFSVSQLLQGSVGFDNVLDLGCKDEFGDDNDQEGLVKLVNDLCIEEHISSNVVDAKVVDEMVLDDKVLDEKVLDAKVMDEKGQAILRLTATEDQQPPSDHQVYAGVGVDVHVDDVQCAQKPPLNEFIEVKKSSDRCRKRKLTGAGKKADRSVDLPILPHITVDHWVEGIVDWVDPPMCQRAVNKIPGLLMVRNRQEAQLLEAQRG
nr:zinc finger, GRF-type [Tanacetum cinerariifolium]